MRDSIRLVDLLRLIAVVLVATASLWIDRAFGDEVLTAELASDEEVEQRATSAKADEKAGKGVVVADKVENYDLKRGCKFVWGTGVGMIEGWAAPARKEKDAVVAGIATQQWNTFSSKSLQESPKGQLRLSPTPPNSDASTITASRWVVSRGGGKWEKGKRLFSRLLDGDEKGKEQFSFRSEVREKAKGESEVMFTITNSTKQPIKFDWGGFEGSLKPGEAVVKKRETKALPEERPATAIVTLPDGEKRLITAHYWHKEN